MVALARLTFDPSEPELAIAAGIALARMYLNDNGRTNR
jgi:hypothetical protein